MQAIQTADVIANRELCRDHLVLTLRVRDWPTARPGQFVHICPPAAARVGYRTFTWDRPLPRDDWAAEFRSPMLRRAFSIAGARPATDGIDIDVIYRVVGVGTQWMCKLSAGHNVSVLGPLGNAFAIRKDKPKAWLVAGGVGLPPMLWLAESLAAAGRKTTAFCGAQSRDLLPLALDAETPLAEDGRRATLSVAEFTRHDVPVVISTDDGSAGFAGHIGAAMQSFHAANPIDSADVVAYTCGPERMMRFVAEHCAAHGIECYVCMERAMACGTGTCQSCVVPVHDADAPDGWRYSLCCTEGPVFPAQLINW